MPTIRIHKSTCDLLEKYAIGHFNKTAINHFDGTVSIDVDDEVFAKLEATCKGDPDTAILIGMARYDKEHGLNNLPIN